jgi:hypothetical protein
VDPEQARAEAKERNLAHYDRLRQEMRRQMQSRGMMRRAAAAAETAAVNEHVRERLTALGSAYEVATRKLHHPPATPDELKPFLAHGDVLASPRDHRPFEVAWGTEPVRGALLIWEKAADVDGGRWALAAGGEARYYEAGEFQTLRAEAAQVATGRPAMSAPPAGKATRAIRKPDSVPDAGKASTPPEGAKDK